jgi:radical SAM superfamily enzyme YgiQ (UPF0313 family)
MKPVTVGLVQINSGSRPFLPYVPGLLQRYVETHAAQPACWYFLEPLSEYLSLEAACEHLAAAAVIGFSVYVWNIRRSLAIARRLKQRRPDCLIVFGGPQVPDQAEAFLRAHRCVDLCVHGEGEATFLALLEADGRWETLAGVSWLDATAHFQTRPPVLRRRELDALPSPYLSGCFDPLIARLPAGQRAVLWETNRGCPFSCTFCDWGSATQSKVNSFGIARLKAELDWFSAHKVDYIFCCDANFGLLPRDLEIAEYAAELRQRTGYPRTLVVQNSKNVTERALAVHLTLARAGLDTDVTLSLQSLNPEVLRHVKRENISLTHFETLRHGLMRAGVKAYTDMILGLPGETCESFMTGIYTLISHGQYHLINMYSANLLPNAALFQPESMARFGLETVATRTVYVHTPVQEFCPETQEYLETVIATATMPRPEWVRAKAFALLISFLFFAPGTLRMALLILHKCFNVSLRTLVDPFCAHQPDYPQLDQVWRFFVDKARAIQQGDHEYCQSPAPYALGQWWQPYELLLRQLVFEGQLAAWSEQAHQRLTAILTTAGATVPPDLLADCLAHSQTFIGLLHQQEVPELRLHWNLWEVYQGLLHGEHLPLRRELSLWRKPWRGAPYRLERLA